MKHAFSRTLPGRAIVIGLAVKIAVFALGLVVAPSSVANAIDTVASVAIVLGAVYFVGRGSRSPTAACSGRSAAS